ncbi:MAG: type I-C CRISPR-associated endonuclease Cas1 [Firmicutes bacterium]|nr:type I-C CRISPR-associated endonuclease Cas1 [Bacillota bacterium]
MRKMLNTLYVTNPDAFLARDGENLVVRINEKEVFRTPIHYLESIVTFGYMGASPALFALCVEKGVSLTFLTQHGKFLASLSGPVKGNVLLRRKQYRIADSPEECVRIASRFLTGKLINSRVIIRRFISDHGEKCDSQSIKRVCSELAKSIFSLQNAKSLDEIRGIEGDGAKLYFSVFDNLILNDKESFFFKKRTRRPPLDNMNALLSFLYTLLLNETKSALETVGLDPYVGFLHRDRPGRPGLALDLMEEFRPYMADRLALTLVNRRQLIPSDFIQKETSGVFLIDSARKTVLEAWQNRKKEEITHPFLGEKIPLGLLPYTQALLLSRFLRGDMDDYPPFTWK